MSGESTEASPQPWQGRKTAHRADVPSWPTPNTRTYRILTTSPGLIEPSAEIVAGTSSSRSRRRFVGPQRITNVANHPNYSLIGRLVNVNTFGIVQSQLPPRQIQFGVEIGF